MIRHRRILEQIPVVSGLLHGARVQGVARFPAVFVVAVAGEEVREGVVGRAGG